MLKLIRFENSIKPTRKLKMFCYLHMNMRNGSATVSSRISCVETIFSILYKKLLNKSRFDRTHLDLIKTCNRHKS